MTSTNLPLQLSTFIGREQDLAAVQRLLSASRLVTLTGAGGSGKTRLAIQAASNFRDTFPDGAWLVELASIHDPILVPQLIAQTVGLRPAVDQPVLDSLLSFLHSKHLLLVLDNCEHLIEACAQLTRQLLSGAPALRILATSREPLSIAGEIIYPVPGLAWPNLTGKGEAPSGAPDPHYLLNYDAVRLFVERAQAVSPLFSLTPDNASAVIEICRRLDGLPLALELASARASVLTPQEIAAHLDDRFALLTSGQRSGLAPRHHTLRAAIDWSYTLITHEEQTLLRRLAVFAAGCTLDTAQAVCSGGSISEEDVLDLLSSLVNKSFLIAESAGRLQSRFRMLETIREYALEKLEESGEKEKLRDRHLDVFLVRAQEAKPKLGDAYQQLWLNWLEGEHDNIRAALTWALESGRIEAGLRICIAIARFWDIRGYVPESSTWFNRFRMKADEKVPLDVRAQAFSYASHMAMFLADASAAHSFASESVALAEAAGEQSGIILFNALAGLASSLTVAGDYQAALEVGERVIRLLGSVPFDPSFTGMAYLASGNAAVEAGRYDRARQLLDESLRLALEAGDAYRVAHTYTATGYLESKLGNYAGALDAFEKSTARLRELDARHDLAAILRHLALTCLHLGDAVRAAQLFRESLHLHQAENNQSGMVECLIGLGSVAIAQGMPAAGARLLASAREPREQGKTHVWPAKPLEIEPHLEIARSQLTASQFEAETNAGRSMPLEQAVHYALDLALEREVCLTKGEKMDNLTEREREVAVLIAQGRSNREIAAELVLSPRTVEKHAANILSKLGLGSRSQIVRWAIEHGLMRPSG